ncbi:unnamed protein product, partial [Ectocarpus sp. 12 AP-2014]
MNADGFIPFPEDSTDEDTHSLVRAKEGAKTRVMAAVGYTASSMTVVSMPNQDPQRDDSTPAPIPSTEPPASTTGDDDINTNPYADPDTNTDEDTSTNTNANANATTN